MGPGFRPAWPRASAASAWGDVVRALALLRRARPGGSPALLAALLLLGPPAHATGPLEQTRAVLEQTRVIVDRDEPHNQKLAALDTLLRTFLDTDTMGRAALDAHWSAFTPAQQREFLALFRELFQRTYVQKLLLFERPDFGYVGEELLDREHARVDTKIITPRDEFAVTYRMRLAGKRWMATDIQIEDLSLTANFRRQMDRLLKTGSREDLLDRMRRKYGAAGGAADEDAP